MQIDGMADCRDRNRFSRRVFVWRGAMMGCAGALLAACGNSSPTATPNALPTPAPPGTPAPAASATTVAPTGTPAPATTAPTVAAAMTAPAASVTTGADNPLAPILFVHGNGDSSALWITTLWRFESNGFPRERLFTIDYPYPAASCRT
ncbi:MAG: hypothetical protein LC793_22570 [Thermomicrobia bacterium]|nr:hypothetical protein [Thermomicrobia bacterium]